MKLIECVPNFSEGRRPEVIAAIRDAIASVSGAHVLDVSTDASHNR
jgi:glutamate formiminotransferase